MCPASGGHQATADDSIGVAGPVQRLNLQDGGHTPHLTHKEEIVRAITQFLAPPPRKKLAANYPS